MTYTYKSARLIIPPPPQPLEPTGSVYANPGIPRADFINAAGQEISLSLKDMRAILVTGTAPRPDDIPFPDLRAGFRAALKLMPHTHSDLSNADVTAAYNSHPDDPHPYQSI